ncbi:MAG TPA: DUF2058 family protein [Xanthomonadales bacterium]|nr:DUF2058 family protein [Xanthomonadales bacterium]
MSNSLQDQLLALGLAKEKPKSSPVQKPRPGRSHGSRQAADAKKGKSHGGAPKGRATRDHSPENISLEQAYRIREQEEKTAKQRARELKMEEDRKRAAINKQIRAIVDSERLNLADASEARYFMYKERIRKVYASKEQLDGLNDGSLGVVYLGGGYHILAAEQINAVRQISPEHVADLLSGASDDDELWAAFEAENNPANGAGPEPEDPVPGADDKAG